MDRDANHLDTLFDDLQRVLAYSVTEGVVGVRDVVEAKAVRDQLVRREAAPSAQS
jgi:hypothetical protein